MALPEELLARVLEAPDDDAPRLVLADALLAAGDPRGELITVQCQLETDKPLTETARTALWRRERELLEEHEARWRAEAGLERCSECWFRRGFIEEVEISLSYGETFDREEFDGIHWERSPIRSLAISGARAAFLALLDHPLLDRLQELRTSRCEVSPEDTHRLATKELRSLLLSFEHLKAAHIVALNDAPALVTLWVSEDSLRADLVEVLCSSSSLTHRLRSVGLHQQTYGHIPALADPQSARLVAAAPWEALNTLSMGGRMVAGDDGVAEILSSRHLTNLQALFLGFNDVGDDGLRAIASSSHLASLESLGLADNLIGDRGVAALVASPSLASLRYLDLNRNSRIREGAAALAEPTSLPRLEELKLRSVPIDEEVKGRLVARFGTRLFV